MYVSYWLFIYKFFPIQISDSKLSLFAATAYLRRYSHKWQRSIIICFVCSITIVIQLRHYIVSVPILYIINSYLEHNPYRFCRYHSKEGKFVYLFGAKLVPNIWLVLFFDRPKVIVWVLITVIQIISRFIFKSLYSKPSIFSATKTVIVPVVSHNVPLSYVLFVALLQSYDYVIT